VHPKNPVRRMQESADWVRYVLERRLVATPGATFDYNSGASHLIAAALQNAAGTTVAAYADERLFRPLGIRTWHWTADPAGVNTGGWGLHLRPRDMVRFGELYLNAGRWDGREVISEVWIRESTSCHVKAVPDGRRGDRLRSFGRRVLGRPAGPAAVDYGYHWWLPDVGCHAALGSAGQAIYVLADERLVVAMTGGLRTSESSLRRELIEQRVLPALRSAAPAGDGQLETTAGAGGLRRTASSALPELPPTAHLVSAQTYVFGENPSRIESLSLRFGRDGEATLDVLLEGRRYELAVGLDRSYRETMIDERNRLALRGAWVDDRTFALEWCWTSSGERLDISLRFARDRVSFRARGAIDGHTRRMVGRLRRP
jgi:hypothetical protein